MQNDIWIAGIARGHNSGVCLLKNGEIVFSIEEERLSRRKYDGGPYAGMVKILDYTNKLDYIVIAHTQGLHDTAGKVDFSGDDVLAGAVSIDDTGITINHVLLSNNVITSPVSIDSTVITQDHKLASLELVTGNVSIPLARFPFMAITTPPESYTDLSVGAESWSNATSPDTDAWPDAVAASTPTFTETTTNTETWDDAA